MPGELLGDVGFTLVKAPIGHFSKKKKIIADLRVSENLESIGAIKKN